jgi:hypothetical protein
MAQTDANLDDARSIGDSRSGNGEIRRIRPSELGKSAKVLQKFQRVSVGNNCHIESNGIKGAKNKKLENWLGFRLRLTGGNSVTKPPVCLESTLNDK